MMLDGKSIFSKEAHDNNFIGADWFLEANLGE